MVQDQVADGQYDCRIKRMISALDFLPTVP